MTTKDTKMRILIIEDSAPNRELLCEILKDFAQCDFAEDGLAAVDAYNRSLLEKNFYDVILLDIGLPEVCGISLLDEIRASEHKAGIPLGSGIPIIMVTGQRNRFLEAYDKGCTDYIVKPISADILLEKVKKHTISSSSFNS